MTTYIVLPDGTVCWSPTESDRELWWDECCDIRPDPEEYD